MRGRLAQAFCTRLRNPEDSKLNQQGDIFFARAEYIGTTPSGKPISENDLLVIRDQYRLFESGAWTGIELRPLGSDHLTIVHDSPGDEERLWHEPRVNRTSLLDDRLCYVLSNPGSLDRFSYTYCHPAYHRTMRVLEEMSTPLCSLESLCVAGYPSCGCKPTEKSSDGIPILKVRNVTGRGIDLRHLYTRSTWR